MLSVFTRLALERPPPQWPVSQCPVSMSSSSHSWSDGGSSEAEAMEIQCEKAEEAAYAGVFRALEPQDAGQFARCFFGTLAVVIFAIVTDSAPPSGDSGH